MQATRFLSRSRNSLAAAYNYGSPSLCRSYSAARRTKSIMPTLRQQQQPFFCRQAVLPARNQVASYVTASARAPASQSARDRYRQHRAHSTTTTLYYTASVIVFFIGATYAAVPLYQLICTQTGLDGTPLTAPGHKFDPESMVPVPNARKIKVRFESSVSDRMRWSFTPVTPEISVVPGETALAFYTAHNPTDEDIVGISTYSVVPAKAAQYFNKIQCFCFEEQRLEANEEVDMPVFFYLDPELAYDPWMKDVKTVTLHYTFFKSKNQ